MGMPNQTAQRLMYGYLRDGYRDVALFPVDLCRGQVHQRAYRGLGGRCWSYLAPIARQTGHDKLLGGAVAHVGKAHQELLPRTRRATDRCALPFACSK